MAHHLQKPCALSSLYLNFKTAVVQLNCYLCNSIASVHTHTHTHGAHLFCLIAFFHLLALCMCCHGYSCQYMHFFFLIEAISIQSYKRKASITSCCTASASSSSKNRLAMLVKPRKFIFPVT